MNQHLAEDQSSDDVVLLGLPKEARPTLVLPKWVLPKLGLPKLALLPIVLQLSSFGGVVRCLAMRELEHLPCVYVSTLEGVSVQELLLVCKKRLQV